MAAMTYPAMHAAKTGQSHRNIGQRVFLIGIYSISTIVPTHRSDQLPYGCEGTTSLSV